MFDQEGTAFFFILYAIFRIIFSGIFIGIHGLLMLGLFKEWRWDVRCRKRSVIPFPSVSVIIPFHNETERMGLFLKSLAAQTYPNAEIIFVDDCSSDNTKETLEKWIKSRGCNTRIVPLTENTGVNRKQYALAKGIERASGEFFLFTDADCEVPPYWIERMVIRISENEKNGAVIGPVFKKTPARVKASNFFYQYQCFDHAVRYMYLAGSTGIGSAGGGFGNNLIIRGETLHLIGGYAAIPSSLTEDAALISRIRTHSDYRVHSALGIDTAVLTLSETSWKSLVNQTLRWNNGGLFSPDFGTRLNFNVLMIMISPV
jgi:cellulose synthase/poly-beta-1,6-N-acetylglucosamine synthase-like glycosyltransferase